MPPARGLTQGVRPLLRAARTTSIAWLLVAFGLAGLLFAARWLFPPTHSEDYGSGLAFVLLAAAMCIVGAVLALASSAAYFTAWRRGLPFVRRDKVLVSASVIALFAFLWPVSWLFIG